MEKPYLTNRRVGHYTAYEFIRGASFNRARKKYNLKERQLQTILIAHYVERTQNTEWGINEIAFSVTESTKSTVWNRIIDLINEGFIEKLDKGVYRLSEKGREVVNTTPDVLPKNGKKRALKPK